MKQVIPYCLLIVLLLIANTALCQKVKNDTLRKPAKYIQVDSHGVPLDTDGDGIPDFRDKELLTPQKCFPVNAEGIGICPLPSCCVVERPDSIGLSAPCTIGIVPSVVFKTGSDLDKDAETSLSVLAEKMKVNRSCKIRITSYGSVSRTVKELSYKRVQAVIKFLIEKKGIAENRLLFKYGKAGNTAVVALQAL